MSNKVTFRWIKAHQGNRLLDKADILAKEGASSKHLHPHIPKTNKDEITATIRESTNLMWRADWTREDKAHQYKQCKLWFPDIEPDKTEELLKEDKATLSKMIQFLSGFNNMNHHQS